MISVVDDGRVQNDFLGFGLEDEDSVVGRVG
jgi:hypothetical protein